MFGLALLAGVGLAGIGGFLWSVLADPPSALVTEQGPVFVSELDYDRQVVATLWFLTLGVLLGLVAGLVLGLLGRRLGVLLVAGVVLMTVVASGLSAWLGEHLFGPDADAALAAASVGDSVTVALTIGSDVAYLGWPVGGLAGLFVAALTWKVAKPPALPWASSSLPAD
jgi:hypothetical protein